MAKATGVVRCALVFGLVVGGALALVHCAAASDDVGIAGGSGAPAAGGVGGSGDASVGSGGKADGGGSGGSLIIDANVKDYSAEELFLDDPPPVTCDGGGKPVVPGGTPQCPDDKNLPGCPCTQVGQTASCWPGLRKHRNRGDCKDGTTTCKLLDEVKLGWGPCEGFQGLSPSTLMPLGATGAAACTCFSGGYWHLDNLSPCFISSSGGAVMGAVSTVMPGNCPNPNSINFNTPVPPSASWTTNDVTVDCTGTFELCYTLKAVSAPGAQPAAGDCVMQEVCTKAYYQTANQKQSFPELKGWITATAAEKACAQKFVANGGYGEMSVDGESDECDKVAKVFQTVTYCPLKCNDPAKKNLPECVNCTNGGGGPF